MKEIFILFKSNRTITLTGKNDTVLWETYKEIRKAMTKWFLPKEFYFTKDSVIRLSSIDNIWVREERK